MATNGNSVMKRRSPYPVGYVEPKTRRVAVLVRDYASSDLNGDAPAYWFNVASTEYGLDPWILVEGVDPHTVGNQFDVCFANGSSLTVGPLATLFVNSVHAEMLVAELSKAAQ